MFKSRGDIVYKCTVRLLEDTEILECEFHPSYKGKFLLDHVCQQLNLTETDYFGLRYVDGSGQRHWLHMAKLILKQVKDATPILFSFRAKFYPPNPLLLKEDVTRFQIYLQLKRDLLHGRLYCTSNEAAMLGALIIQIELGDYDPSIHVGNYVTEMRLLLRQTDIIEARIQELHREPVEGTPGGSGGVKGMSTQEAERTFLKIACQLDTYGVDPHPVKQDHRGNQLYLGINHSGILTFQGSRKTHHFKWSEVHKINFEGRMFIVHLNYPEKKHTVGFKCPSGAACRHVWCCAIEQMLFFTLPSSSDACVYSGGGLFSWGTKFKYVGRTEREILERDGLLAPRDSQEEGSTTGGKRKASSVPATPSTPMTGDFVGYSSLPRSTHSAPLEESAGDAECNGACLLSGPAVDIALACCDHLRPADEPKPPPIPSEYRLRESFEQSSSESGGTSAVVGTELATGLPVVPGGPGVPILAPRPFSLLRAFVPSFALAWLALALLALLLFETEWAPLRALRRKPELLALRTHYYTPLKDYLKRKLLELF